jgi:hypothetical protein
MTTGQPHQVAGDDEGGVGAGDDREHHHLALPARANDRNGSA